MGKQDTSSSYLYLGDQTCVFLSRRIQVSGKRNAPRGQAFDKEPHNFDMAVLLCQTQRGPPVHVFGKLFYEAYY